MDPVRSARWIARLAIPVVVAGMVGTVAWWVQSKAFPSTGRDAPVAIERNIETARSVAIEGAWRVEIVQGSEPSVQGKNIPAHARDDWLRVTDRGFELTGIDGVSRPEATIVVASLETLEIDGTAAVTIRDQVMEALSISVEGSVNVEGVNVTVERLSIEIDGAGRIDFTDSRVVNANIDIDGAGKVDLTMDGGVIAGTIDGVGQVTYSGSVTNEEVNVRGLGTVRQR